MASLCWWVSGKSTWRNSPIVPPILHIYQNKFADQTLACFPIGPWTLIGSQGLCWGGITAPHSWLWPVSASSDHGYSGLGGRRTCTDPKGRHQKTTSRQEDESVGFSLKGGPWRCDQSTWGENLSSLEKGISLFFSLNFLRIFSRCPIVLLHWFGLYRFGTNSAPKWKLLDYPLRSTVSFTIWGIYLLIPSTWNNLDELNLLITHQTRRARPALTTEFIQHWIHPFFFTSAGSLHAAGLLCFDSPFLIRVYWTLSSFLFRLCVDRCMVVSHGAVEDEFHPAAAGASGPGAVAAVLAGSHVWDLHLLSGGLP